MRTKKPFLIALFLCAWTIVSYYLLIRQTDSGNNLRDGTGDLSNARRHRDDLLRQLNRLEENIQEENVIHDQLVKKLMEIVRLKDQKDGAAGSVRETMDKNHSNNGNAIGDNSKFIEAKANPIHGDSSIVNHLNAPNIDNENKDDGDAPLINRLRELNKRNHDFKGPIIPVLVFACNRISVRNCLDDLIRYRPNAYQFPIIVSQVSFSYITNFFGF